MECRVYTLLRIAYCDLVSQSPDKGLDIPAVTMIAADRSDIRPRVIMLNAVVCLNERSMHIDLNSNVRLADTYYCFM